MQITKDLSKTKKLFYRYANYLLILVALTYMCSTAIGVVTSIVPDLKDLFIVPKVEDYTFKRWLMSGFIAVAICLEWFLYGVIQRARARIKLYTVE